MANSGRRTVDFISELPGEVAEEILLHLTRGSDHPVFMFNTYGTLCLVNKSWNELITNSRTIWGALGRNVGIVINSGKDTSHLAANPKLLFHHLVKRRLSIDIDMNTNLGLSPAKTVLKLAMKRYRGLNMLAYDSGLIIAGK